MEKAGICKVHDGSRVRNRRSRERPTTTALFTLVGSNGYALGITRNEFTLAIELAWGGSIENSYMPRSVLI